MLQRLVSFFESHAHFNSQAAQAADQDNLFLFPCFFAGDTGIGEWLFSFNYDDGQDDDMGKGAGYNISFYLQMTNLGDVHLKLHMGESALDGVVTLGSEAAAVHVNDNLHQLTSVLEKMYGQVYFSCRYLSKSCFQQFKDDIIAKSELESFTLVDLKA